VVGKQRHGKKGISGGVRGWGSQGVGESGGGGKEERGRLPTQDEGLVPRWWSDVRVVLFSEGVVTKGRNVCQCMEDHIHVVVSLGREEAAQYHETSHSIMRPATVS